MSLLPNQTNINMNEYFFLRGTGMVLSVSTLNATNISSAAITTSSIQANTLSTSLVTAEEVNTGALSSIQIDIDGQTLTANPTELLLNGIPVATLSNLSSIADWSLDPAISTVRMDGNNLIGAGNISTNSIVGGTAFFGQLMALNSMFLSSYVSSISSLVEVAEEGYFSTLSTGTAYGGSFLPSSLWGQPSSYYAQNPDPFFSTVSAQTGTFSTVNALEGGFSSINGLPVNSYNPDPAFSTVTASNATLSSINGQAITTGAGGNAANWAQYPANSNVTLNGFSTLVTNGVMALNASGSVAGGTVDVTADSGIGGGGFGTVRINANGGSTGPIGVGGLVEINANTPAGFSNLTSAIKLNAAGINSYAGAIPSFGSEAGYQFLYGTTGINMCVTLPSLGFQIPGTLYMYAPGSPTNGGIRMESPAGVEMINNTDFYFYRQYPYYNPFQIGAPPNGLISGRVAGGLYNQYIDIEHANHIYFGFGGERIGQIDALSTINNNSIDNFETYRWATFPASAQVQASSISGVQLQNVSSINGQPITYYEPGGVSTISTFVDLNASTLTVSSINGAVFPQVITGFDTLTVSTLNTSSIFSQNSTLVLSNADLANLVMNSAGDITAVATNYINLQAQGTGGQLAGLVLNATGLGSSSNFATGPLYMSASTIKMSTNILQVNSISSLEIVSISSLNGQPISYYEPGGVSTVSSFVDLYTQNLAASTINMSTGTINMVDGDTSYIRLGSGGNQNGQIIGGANPSVILDGPTSVIEAQGMSVDFLQSKNNPKVEVIVPLGVSSLTAANGQFSTISLGTSTLLTTNNTFSELKVLNPATESTAQVLAGIYKVASFDGDLNVGAFGRNTTNRAVWVDSNAVVNPLAYISDIPGTVSSFSNLFTSSFVVSTISIGGISTINLSTSASAGSVGQPAGRLVMGGNDLDLGQNDLWCQQVRLGFANPGGSAQSELIFYDPTGATTRALNVGGLDRTIRIQSTINAATGAGYLLDTALNPPIFSTINAGTSTALVSYFPSTSLNTIGYSTLTVMPPLTYIASVYDSTTQPVVAANTSTPLVWNTTSINLGGFTVGTSTLTAPVAGVYELNTSIQLETTSGGTNIAEFWMTKNGAAVAQTNSKMAVVNNGDTLGTITIFDTAAAGDQYGWMLYSSDNNMTATASAAGATPAIPSIIFNAKRIG